VKKIILLLTLIPVHFWAMDQAENKQEIAYCWQTGDPRFKVPMNLNATIADFKRAIGEQKKNNNFDLRVCFSKDKEPLSETDIEKIKSLVPNCELSRIELYCICGCLEPIIDPNRVNIMCEESTTLKTVMDAGNALTDFGISQPRFKATPK